MRQTIGSMTDGALAEHRDNIVREFYRRARGGTQFGVDRTTMRTLWPELTKEFDDVEHEIAQRAFTRRCFTD